MVVSERRIGARWWGGVEVTDPPLFIEGWDCQGHEPSYSIPLREQRESSIPRQEVPSTSVYIQSRDWLSLFTVLRSRIGIYVSRPCWNLSGHTGLLRPKSPEAMNEYTTFRENPPTIYPCNAFEYLDFIYSVRGIHLQWVCLFDVHGTSCSFLSFSEMSLRSMTRTRSQEVWSRSLSRPSSKK